MKKTKKSKITKFLEWVGYQFLNLYKPKTDEKEEFKHYTMIIKKKKQK